ncbi:hypothetical protein ACP3P8_14060 [Pseudomonas aeruginosa]
MHCSNKWDQLCYTEIFKPQTDRDRNDKVLGPTKGKNTEVGIKESIWTAA